MQTPNSPRAPRPERGSFVRADLKAQTAAVEAGFVHGAVLVHEAMAQVPVLQGVQLAVGIAAEQLLGQMQQRPQLTQSAAVGLHLGRVVLRPEEGTAVVGGDVAALVNDVKETRLQDLHDKERQSGVWTGDTSSLFNQHFYFHFNRDTLSPDKNVFHPSNRKIFAVEAPAGPPQPNTPTRPTRTED